MILGRKAKVFIAVVLFAAAYAAGKVIEHYEGETFREEIVTSYNDAERPEPQDRHIIDGKLNINAATKDELMELNGIGDKLSERIIEYRETNGKFVQVEGIMLIPGIGESLYGKIKDYITVE